MSGHAVNCQRIKMRDAEEIYNEIEYKLHKVNPDWPISAIGSLFKKNLDDETGDIDIAIVYNVSKTDSTVKEMLAEKLNEILGDNITEINLNTTPKILSIGYKYNNIIAQVDFMLVNNIAWAKWRFQSPDLKNGESKYKADPKVFLMQYMFSALPLNMPIEYFEDGETIKAKYKYTLNQEGLWIQKLNYEGKRGKPVKNPSREVYKFISDNPYKVTEYLFPLYDSDPEYDENTFHCVEKLWNTFHQQYKYESDRDYVYAVEKRFYEEYINNPRSECKLDPNDFPCKFYKG